MPKPNSTFKGIFTNEVTGEEKIFEFTLQQYIQARMWMLYPETAESAAVLALWLNESNINRQSAYCAVRVWQSELKAKGAH